MKDSNCICNQRPLSLKACTPQLRALWTTASIVDIIVSLLLDSKTEDVEVIVVETFGTSECPRTGIKPRGV